MGVGIDVYWIREGDVEWGCVLDGREIDVREDTE